MRSSRYRVGDRLSCAGSRVRDATVFLLCNCFPLCSPVSEIAAAFLDFEREAVSKAGAVDGGDASAASSRSTGTADEAGDMRVAQFLVMEYIPLTLAAFLGNLKCSIDWPTFKVLALDVLSGLKHLQRHGVVHVDVRLPNILVDVGGGRGSRGLRAVLCDFGAAMYSASGNATKRCVGFTMIFNLPA